MTYSRGASASSRLVALQKALETTNNVFSCTWGAIEVGCEKASNQQDAFTCQAACKNSDGSPALSYSKVASASTELEALINASKLTQDAYSCTWGVVKARCERN
jgi:hypothetical protein